MNDYIKKFLEEFDKEFVKDNGKDIEPSFMDPEGSVGPIKYFLEKSLTEAFEKGKLETASKTYKSSKMYLRAFREGKLFFLNNPMGVSVWKNIGKKFGYWEYFEDRMKKKELGNTIVAVNAEFLKGLEDPTSEIVKIIKEQAIKEYKKEVRKNIGMLRQWLNEDRINENDKMVTSKQIEKWLCIF